jgi:surface antigen
MKRIIVLFSAFFISGCAANVQTSSSNQGPKESVGALSGMVIGGALANDMAGDSRNKSLATVLGAFVGGVIGQNIGAQLDERDRLLAGEAYNTALEYNPIDKAAEWRNPDTGNYGRVIPVTTYRQNGRYCREFTQEIFIGGKKQTGYGRACRQPDGSWEIIG